MTSTLVLLVAACGILPGPAAASPARTHAVAPSPSPAQAPVVQRLIASGADPFDVLVQPSAGPPSSEFAKHVFLRSLERADKPSELIAASGDEFYRIGPGAPRLIGQITVADSFVRRFARNQSILLPVAQDAVLEEWVLEAELGFAGTNGYVEHIATAGVMTTSAGPTVLLERTVADGPNSVTLRATLQAGKLVLTYLDTAGLAPFVLGSFRATLLEPNPTLAAAIAIDALTLGPDRTLYALSDADTDPFGCAGLYTLQPARSVVHAERLADVTAPALRAIEFDDAGVLWAGGDGLYLLDPLDGTETLVSTIDGATLVDLDCGFDGILRGVAIDEDGLSELIEFSPSGEPLATAPIEPAGVYWGLATRLYEDPATALTRD